MSKREREHNIQGWFDPDDAEENAVIQAFAYLRQKFPAMSPKWVLGNAVLFAAQGEGFDPQSSPSGFDGRIEQLFMRLDRITFLLENGSVMPSREAAQELDEVTVQMDAISASVGNRYRPISFEDEE